MITQIPNFDMDKLPEYMPELMNKRVAIIGTGAVGSYVAEILAKACVVSAIYIDQDTFEVTNIAKSSFAYDVCCDEGQNKALALEKGINYTLGGDFVHGIATSISNLGPMAFADFDVILLALDNYAAKEYCNQIWLQIPKSRKPILISGGTYESLAQSSCVDGNDVCLRCLLPEAGFDNPLERTSCTGINYRAKTLYESARTTGAASILAASFMSEQCVGYLLGHKSMLNTNIMYSSYPNFSLVETKPIRKKNCPDCNSVHPVEDIEMLPGMDVLHTTVRDLVSVVKNKLDDENFEILAPSVKYGKITYNKIIKDDYCRCCGSKMKAMYRHEFKTIESDLLCEKCKSEGKKAVIGANREKTGTYIGAITLNNCDEKLRNKTLYDIGFPLGAIIKVKQETGGLSCLDSEITYTNFYCENDQQQLYTISKLEG